MARKSVLLVLSEDESAVLQAILDASGAAPQPARRPGRLALAAAVVLLLAGAVAAVLLIPDFGAQAGQWLHVWAGR